MHKTNEILEAKAYIEKHTKVTPTIGIILGSGLGPFADTLEDAVHIPYDEIPHFAKSAAVGHANELVIGTIAGKTVVAMKGRFHYYEGFTLDQVTFPVRVMKALGMEKMIVTNACGAVNTDFSPGDLMLITDHINLTANNPLMGPNNDELGVRFLDVSEVYSKQLRSVVSDVAKDQNVTLQEGVYAWWTGPTYETPAEIRMIRTLGADAVGMSTVPEALIARHAGIETVGISCLTNMACGILDQPLNHEEVIETAERVKSTFLKLVTEVIARF
ncbi:MULTISPECIES: purine-nucleoside phosphorylase [Brochothrix]|uniref:Purine nucleoside phosphorylase n=1 Tax=Brochothrix thermosphacta TaxID=2756 RepID=A0A1D2L396_BROTH|nr:MULTISPECIES: purine-nucleoside phosphorylase [Brochothrix]SLM89801.1 Purine nucleoside phosphorylase [Brachybacterium faecium]ANZ95407.1 purine-nucleoside phosphorylase [Brochothrix thermosphacta]ANZ96321.1 purine-nucleoside phosphorylase [Brochothrix thermosphacta]ATF25736.1 purine-nucleoside phosphorylase [Brochothrix thermosphacta]ATH85072.1 purine-nucleoside phosphorylase [Brochothrix thermosphacta]